MIYKFKSRETGDVIMLEAHGEQMLDIIGHPVAPKGIIEVAAMPAAIEALKAAIAGDEAPKDADADGRKAPQVGLHQRLWPVIDMLQRAHAADTPVVWGV